MRREKGIYIFRRTGSFPERTAVARSLDALVAEMDPRESGGDGAPKEAVIPADAGIQGRIQRVTADNAIALSWNAGYLSRLDFMLE
jgi:hypothetical protein